MPQRRGRRDKRHRNVPQHYCWTVAESFGNVEDVARLVPIVAVPEFDEVRVCAIQATRVMGRVHLLWHHAIMSGKEGGGQILPTDVLHLVRNLPRGSNNLEGEFSHDTVYERIAVIVIACWADRGMHCAECERFCCEGCCKVTHCDVCLELYCRSCCDFKRPRVWQMPAMVQEAPARS